MIREMTTIIIIAATVILIGYDVFAFIFAGADATISVVIWEASKDFPMVPFGFGVLMGHFFWQNK